jgi:voltage-dependent potassium channel beta subunit
VTFKNQLAADSAYELMRCAFESGVNFFDNAEVYAAGGSETVMGVALARGVADGVWKRSDLVITTKIFFGVSPGVNARGLSRKHIVEGLDASLQRLQLSYVDVVYAHRPDPVTPLEETVRAFNHVIDQGKAFYWGCSEWSAREIAEAAGIAARLGLVGPLCEQPEYNIFARQRVEVEYAPLYAATGLGLTTWSPLASGVLTGKYSGLKVPAGSRLALESYQFLTAAKIKGDEAWQVAAADALAPVAADVGCSLAQLAIAWVLKNPRVSTCILGATSVAQLQENLRALDFVDALTPDVMARIEAAVAAAGGAPPRPGKVELQVRGLRNVADVANFSLA